MLKYYTAKASKYLQTGTVPFSHNERSHPSVGVYSLFNITVMPAQGTPTNGAKKYRDHTLQIKWKLKEKMPPLYLSALSEPDKKDWLMKLGACAELNDISDHDVDADQHRLVLGVAKDASLQELKIKYRKMALTHHPDRGGDVQKFKDMKTAYTVLVALKESELKRQNGQSTNSGSKEVLFDVDVRKTNITMVQGGEPCPSLGLNIKMTRG